LTYVGQRASKHQKYAFPAQHCGFGETIPGVAKNLALNYEILAFLDDSNFFATTFDLKLQIFAAGRHAQFPRRAVGTPRQVSGNWAGRRNGYCPA